MDAVDLCLGFKRCEESKYLLVSIAKRRHTQLPVLLATTLTGANFAVRATGMIRRTLQKKELAGRSHRSKDPVYTANISKLDCHWVMYELIHSNRDSHTLTCSP